MTHVTHGPSTGPHADPAVAVPDDPETRGEQVDDETAAASDIHQRDTVDMDGGLPW